MPDYDPFAVIEHRFKLDAAMREFITEAIDMIENDMPNAAKRHLMQALEFGPDKRIKAAS